MQFIEITKDGIMTGMVADESGNVICDEMLSMLPVWRTGIVKEAVKIFALIDKSENQWDLEWDRCDRQVAFVQPIDIVCRIPQGYCASFHLGN